MMTFEIVLVLLGLVGMVAALILDKMRPGMVLFSVVVLFLCAGILTPKEMLEGFSNKGMITVALLYLVSEGIRQSGALGQLIKKLLPQKKTTVFKAQLRMLPTISFISAFLNNTPVVVIFAPIIKRWADSVKLPATKFLIPLSYVTILGGICTLIGTSTNLVVHGMILEAGYEGFTMFELGKVGIFIAIAGILYLFIFSSKLLPDVRKDSAEVEEDTEEKGNLHRVEAVLGPRFPGINKRLKDFNFKRHYGAEVKEIKRGGQSITENLENRYLREGDTLVVMADDSFIQTWGESSVFVMLANGKDNEPVPGRGKRWLALALLVLMIAGATIGELPFVKEAVPNMQLDMFFFVSITTIIMAGLDEDFPCAKIYQIHLLGCTHYHCLRFCYQQGNGQFRCGRYGSQVHYRFERPLRTSCFAGGCVHYHQSVHGAYHEQRGGGFGFPLGTLHFDTVGRKSCAVLCGDYFDTVGRKSCAVLCGDLYGGFRQFLYAYRLSDKLDCARYR